MVWWRSRQPAPMPTTKEYFDSDDKESSIGYSRPRSAFPEMGGRCPSTLNTPVTPAGRSPPLKTPTRLEMGQRRATIVPASLTPARSTLTNIPTRPEMGQRRATTLIIPAPLTPGGGSLSKTPLGPRYTMPPPLTGLSRTSLHLHTQTQTRPMMGHRRPSSNLTITIPGSNTPSKTTRDWYSLEGDICPSMYHRVSASPRNASQKISTRLSKQRLLYY